MLLNSLYFRVRPLMPRVLRLRIRRLIALRTLRRLGGTWPIMPGSERVPANWPGWPKRSRFAFVLTHDVEAQRGLDQVKALAEIEIKLGFRSSFNFVPEGDYAVPSCLRSWLMDRGFEVGVHDLQHDGHLYSSRHEFHRKAMRINKTLKEWNVSGFRSAYMLRNLEWIQELDIAYDSSTFDTDPFEPQPEGVNTIFPFWVPRRPETGAQSPEPGSISHQPSAISASEPLSSQPVARRSPQSERGSTFGTPRSGYVELPYTLPQDSTLFLVLKEPNGLLWQQKLSWIATHGGMALLNVHPDFIAFGNERCGRATYPVTHYVEFLTWVKQNHLADLWHVRPATLASFIKSIHDQHETIGDDGPLQHSSERLVGSRA